MTEGNGNMMDVDVKGKLESLRSKTSALSAPMDELNTRLLRIEDALIEMRPGVAADVPMGEARLSFRKHHGRWGLYVLVAGGSPNPICSVSRKHRLLAVRNLELLIEELCKMADGDREDIVQALEKLDVVLSAFEVKAP
jgi:hypothetical protein